jgi:hypothetical protein
MSPCYKILVKTITANQIVLQVNYFNTDRGFDFENPTNILRLLFFGAYYFDTKGNSEKFKVTAADKNILYDNLYNKEWLAAHAKDFYTKVTCLNESEYLDYLCLEKLPPNIILDPRETTFEQKRAFFNRSDYPKCVIAIEVTKEEYVKHLSKDMFFEVY